MASGPNGEDVRVSILRTIGINLAGTVAASILSGVLGLLRRSRRRHHRHGQDSDHPYTDPTTGDKLTRGEHWAWVAQRVMRRWSFLLLITLITIACWTWGSRVPDILVWWNLVASYAALVIESLTAMALINQTIRDAVINRKTHATSARVAILADQSSRMEREHGEQLTSLHTKMDAMQATLAKVAREPKPAAKRKTTTAAARPRVRKVEVAE